MTVAPITTYATLQAAMGSWAFDRTDLPAIPCIALAEAEMRAETGLKLRIEEVDSTLTGVVGNRKIALPAAFMEALELYRETGENRDPLSRVSASEIDNLSSAGIPQYWCIDGTNVAFERPCDAAYTFTLRNAQYLPALSDSNTTNWLLTNYPNLYLAACNVQVARWIQDDTQELRWTNAYNTALNKVATSEARAKGPAPLRTEVAHIGRMRTGGYNIYSDT